jgi:hypothetical protein
MVNFVGKRSDFESITAGAILFKLPRLETLPTVLNPEQGLGSDFFVNTDSW